MSFARCVTIVFLALLVKSHAAQVAIGHKNNHEEQNAANAARTEDETFDIVSIRPSKAGGQLSFGLTPGGFTAHSTPMFWIIMEAYYPGPMSYWHKDRLTGAPSWVASKEFDIDAKLSDSELNPFSHLTEKERETRIKLMLRAALRERLQLQVSEGSRPSSAWALTVGKHNPKVKPSNTDTAAQSGISITDGGVMRPLTIEDNRHAMQFYRTSMPAFAEVLAGFGTENDLPIVDNTGLQGRYDFILEKREAPSELSLQEAPAPATQWDIEGLGFRLRRVTQDFPSLVVIHVDEPTAN